MEHKHEFDNFAGDYEEFLAQSVASYGGDLSYYARHKAIVVSQNTNLHPRSILDFGCGIGRNIPFLQQYFPEADVSGYDISSSSVAMASAKCPSARFFSEENISELDMPIDIVLAACVFHHVEPEARTSVMREAASFLSEIGEIFIVEHNPLNPLTRKAVKNCPLDQDAELLSLGELKKICRAAGLRVTQSGYTLFFPAALKTLQPIEKVLTRIPFGTQYFIKARRPDR